MIKFQSDSANKLYDNQMDYKLRGFEGGESGDGGDSNEICKIDTVFENWGKERLNELKELIPTIRTVYQWNILKNGKHASTWTCDFKNNEGAIYRGLPKIGKADCTFTIDDDLVVKIFEGEEDAMKAFMKGKLKISGNILAAQKLQRLWSEEGPQSSKAKKTSVNPPASIIASTASEVDPDVDAIPISGLKCDLIFNIFRSRSHEEPEFMKRLRTAFQFNVTKDGKPACVWTADNKSEENVLVYRETPRNIKPDCTITIEDDDLLRVMTGKVNPQRLFMQGKVRVKGNIMLLQKLNSLWLEFQKLGKTPELPLVVNVLIDDPLKVGLRSEAMIVDLIQRLVRLPELKKEAPGIYQLDFTKDGKLASQWILDLQNEPSKIVRGSVSSPTSRITMDDYDFAKLVLMKMKLSDAITNGKVKVEGSKDNVLKLNKLFTTPLSLKPKL